MRQKDLSHNEQHPRNEKPAARSEPVRRIAFIGIGNMGSAMAAHLVQSGFDVAVYDARAEAVETFVGCNGGRRAATIADAARGADAVITMLPTADVVRQVVMGAGGAAGVLQPGAVVIDMGTSSPTATRALAEMLAPRGIDVIDAPVMGGVVFAKDATLDIMAGGQSAVIERCRPLLSAMGRSLIECGPVGTGHALKALANYVNACALINSIEAIAIGRKLGIDSTFMAQALIPLCAGRNHPIEKKVLPHVLTRKYGTGMTIGLITKDLKIARDTAASVEAFAPLAEKVYELWAAAAEQLGEGVDQTQIVRFWEDPTGVRL
jgi:3-hydroxyisobutyrate dehydrogenase